MVRSKWTTSALIAGLACAGLTFAGLGRGAQALGKLPAGIDPAKVITISEAGMAPQQCVIQKTTRQPDGKVAHEIRNLSTGEVSTVYMEDAGQFKGDPNHSPWAKSGSQGKPNDAILAPGGWGPSGTVRSPSIPIVPGPKSQPVSSAKPIVQSSAYPTVQPAAKPAAQMPVGAPAQHTLRPTVQAPASPRINEEVRTIEEPGKPTLQCRVIMQWRTAEGHNASQLQAIGNGEYLTIVETGGETAENSSDKVKVTAKLYHWGTSKTPPAGVPVPSAAVNPAPPRPISPPVVQSGKFVSPPAKSIVVNDAEKHTLIGKIKSAFGGGSAPIRTTQPLPTTTIVNNNPPKTTTEAAKVHNPWKTVEAAKPVQKMAPAEIIAEKSTAVATSKPAEPKKSESGSVPSVEPMKFADAPTTPVKSPELPKAPANSGTSTTVEAPPLLKTPEAPTKPAASVIPPTPPALIPPPPLPAPPTGVDKSAVVAPSPKIPSVGKPSADTTLPVDIAPALTPIQPPQPNAVNGPNLGSASQPTAPLTGGNPTPSLPPSLSAALRASDPLANPERLLPGKIEKDAVKPPSVGVAKATDQPMMPLGAGSVAAAGGDPRFAPMPMVTVPQAKPPMQPMPPMLPGTLPMGNGAVPTQAPETFVNAFTVAPPQGQQQPAMNMQQPMMPQGYGMPMMPPQPQTSYRGPMPPNPFGMNQPYPVPMMPMPAYGMPVAPQGYPVMMAPQGYPMPMMPMQQPSMGRPGAATGGSPTLQHSVNILRSSAFPTERELAVWQLSMCDPSVNPQVVQLMLTTAKDDQSPMVRAACVTSLARMGVTTEAAVAVYTQLKSDADPRVRQEAEQALARTSTVSNVQPASATNRQ